MSEEEQRAVVHLCLLAAYADGDKHEREREEVRRIAEGLAQARGLHLPTLTQDVLLQRTSLPQIAQQLSTREARQLAYEMALCVCDADGLRSAPEREFLAQASAVLGLDRQATQVIDEHADALAEAPLAAAATPASAVPTSPAMPSSPSSMTPGASPPSSISATSGTSGTSGISAASGTSPASPASPASPTATAAIDEAAMDKKILDAAILNGALELLPESLSTLAIIPLQMKLVYGIGQAHGFELDRGHVKDFLATLGVGLTSQYLEQAGRKLLGGMLGSLGGGLLRGLGRQAVSSGLSFATTYALGHVARRYYAGGRTMSQQVLRQAFDDMSQRAQGLREQHLPAIEEQARTLRTLQPQQLLGMVRGRSF